METARRVVRYDAKARVGGGYRLGHRPSSYGLVLKWLIKQRGMTYAEFARRYNGTTAQNLNNLINRVDESRFFEEDVERMCKVLKVSEEFFVDLANKVRTLMEGADEDAGE